MSATNNSMLILQETCIDAAGSLVIYAPVDVPAMNAVMNGGDPSFVALLPSGFAIVPACERSSTSTTICPATGMSGSLLTVAFQILVNSLPTAKLTVESVETVNNLISSPEQILCLRAMLLPSLMVGGMGVRGLTRWLSRHLLCVKWVQWGRR